MSDYEELLRDVEEIRRQMNQPFNYDPWGDTTGEDEAWFREHNPEAAVRFYGNAEQRLRDEAEDRMIAGVRRDMNRPFDYSKWVY
jgi:hypothetical protein